MNMKKLNVTLAILVAAVMAGNAQTSVNSSIVGYESKSLPANSYTSVGINLLNPDVLVSSVSGATSTALNVSGSSNVGALLAVTTPQEPYYVEVKSGALEGCRLDVDVAATIAAANGSIVISGSSLNNTDPYVSIYTSLVGANLVLRKHVTLSDVATQITNLTAGSAGTGDEILMLNSSGGFDSYLRRTSTQWRNSGGQNSNATPIPPGVGFIIKKAAVAGSIATVGAVRDNNFSLNARAGYQIVTLGYPLDRSPADLGAGVASSAWTFGTSGDSFLLLNSVGGFDTYLYRGATVWRNSSGTTVTSTKFLTSGSGYVLYRNTAQNFDFVKPTF
jgi:hypothetical protein